MRFMKQLQTAHQGERCRTKYKVYYSDQSDSIKQHRNYIQKFCMLLRYRIVTSAE